MLAKNVCALWVAVTVVMMAVVTQANTAGKSDIDRLHIIQEEFLSLVGNLTSSVKDVEELMTELHSQNGRQMGRLLMEGVMLGAGQKDSGALLVEFWAQLHARLSPEFQDKMKDYTDFLGSIDFSTLPYFLEQMFKKDEQGNSIASMPMGQLMDMVQPVASKYGVDLRAFMDSVMGKGKNNARDLIFAALDNLNVTSLFQLFSSQTGNEVRNKNEVRTMDAESEVTDTKSQTGEKSKKGKGDSTLRLFRPLVASMLKENKIDLDADAVLEVLSPLLNGDLMSQLAPLLSAFGSQAGDGIVPVLNLLGGEKGMGKQAQPAGLLGVMGTLLARGNNNNMDLEGMLTMASMFMNINDKQGQRKTRPSKTMEPDFGVLANLAEKLVENNDVNNLLKEASNFLTPNKKKNEIPKLGERKLEKPTTQLTGGEKPKQFTDLIEPILQAMLANEQDNRRIRTAIHFGKAFLAKNANIGGFVQQVSAFLSMYSMDPAKEKKFLNLQQLLANNNIGDLKWAEIFRSLQNKETRLTLIQTMTPTLSELVLQLGSKETMKNIYMVAELKVQTIFASYGVKGVTFKNFPQRLAPLAQQMAGAWRLPLSPVAHLEHLKDYLQLLHEWISEGLAYMNSLPSREDAHKVVKTSLIKAGDNVVGVYEGVREESPHCLPLTVCRLNADLEPSLLATAVTRAASLLFAMEPALEVEDPTLLLRVLQASSGTAQNCQMFGRECSAFEAEEDDSLYESYEHVEL